MKGKTVFKTVLTIIAGGFALIGLLGLLAPLIFVALFYLLFAQTNVRDAAPDRLMFINQSSVPVYSVTMNDAAISNRTLELGDDFTAEWDVWPGTLSVYGETECLAELYISEEPNQDWAKDCWYVIAQDGPEGLILTQSHTWPLEKQIENMGKLIGLDISAGVVEMYYAPGRGINGDGSDYMSLLFTAEDGKALEQELAETKGWNSLPMNDVIGKIFCGDPDCISANHAVWAPKVEEGWYFFRDTYNAYHGENDESQWEVEGRTRLPQNFTAGIYDIESNTLYIFDYDS